MTIQVQEHVALAPLTTMKVGGPARYFSRPTSIADLQACLQWAQNENVPLLILGGGSNVLISDSGFPGLVIQPDFQKLETVDDGEFVILNVGAGVEWDDLVAQAVARGLGGITCLSGIPGSVGAAPIQNIGAYGQELSETCLDVVAVDLKTGQQQTFDKEACAFSYRDSFFKRHPGRYCVTGLRLRLQRDGRAVLRYPDLKQRLTADASLSEVRETVLQVRRQKSMVVDANDPNSSSCGSFFTNPILDQAAWETLKRLAEDLEPPHYPTDDGRTKVPAAWLIEQAGFAKGYGSGPAGLSEKHTLAIVNRGNAKAADVLALAREVRAGVEARFGVTLVPEPVFIGMQIKG
jgi:UDP-N-acetylmuramate dehydrogenase